LDPTFVLSLAAEGGGINLFPELNELIWTTINFVVLLAVLYVFLFKPLLKAISTRELEIQTSLQKAAEDRVEAERLRKDFEAAIANAHREAHDIIAKATKAAEATKDQIEAEARAKAVDLVENATRTIEREKVKAIAELREEVATLAVAIAGKVIEKNLDTDEQKRLAERFVAEVGKH